MWLDCVRRYASKTDNPSWFMSLYKRALATRLIDLASVDTRHKTFCLLSDAVSEDDATPEAVGETENEGYLRRVVAEAPSEIRAVITLLFSAPTEILDMVSSAWSGRGKTRSSGSKALCRMLGIPERETLLDDVKEYLAPSVL